MPVAPNNSQKIATKTNRVMAYWGKTSLLIPNVFRLARLLENDSSHLFEYQDLSRKEVLVQSNGQKTKDSAQDSHSFLNSCNNVNEAVGGDDFKAHTRRQKEPKSKRLNR